MKIYINKYKYHWVSPYTICEKICWWREIDYDEQWVKFSVKILSPFSEALQKFLDIVDPKINYVKIDKWDTWSMDSTLAPIILPMLKQLKETKHGSPFVDNADVPAKLRTKVTGSLNADTHKISEDPKFHRRWDYILNEMIWAFEQLCMNDHESQFFDHSLANNPKDDLDKQVRKIKVDRVGLKKHNDRIDNALQLFGKYYRALWD
jgi:hypothetical protein